MRKSTLLLAALPIALASCIVTGDVNVGNPCVTPLLVSVTEGYADTPSERDDEYATISLVDREVIPPGIAVKVSDQDTFDTAVFAVWVDEADFVLKLAYGDLPDDKTVWLPDTVCPSAVVGDRAVVLVEPGGDRDGEEPSEVHAFAPPTATADFVTVASTLGGAEADAEVDANGVVHARLWPFRATDYTLDPLLDTIIGQSSSTFLSLCDENGCIEELLERGADPPSIPLPAGERAEEWYIAILGLAVIGGLAFLTIRWVRRWLHTRRSALSESSGS